LFSFFFLHHFQHLVLAISFYVWTFSFHISYMCDWFILHKHLWSIINRRVVGCSSIISVLARLLVVRGVVILLVVLMG
jgi:hypothetical protein